MSDSEKSPFIYGFEQIGADLPLLPLAARRALDRAGLKLSLEGWVSLGVKERRTLAMLGAEEVVDVMAVAAIALRAQPIPVRMDVKPEPDTRTPPSELSAALAPLGVLDSGVWSSLRGLDRYALVAAYQKAIARNEPSLLETTFEAVMRSLSWSASAMAQTTRVLPEMLAQPIVSMPAAPATEQMLGTESTMSAPSSVLPAPGSSPSAAGDAPSSERKSSSSKMRKTLVSAVDPTQATQELTTLSNHLNAQGLVHMVDVGEKHTTERRAVASAVVKMRRETAERIVKSDAPKGEVLSAARIAGIMAAKRTSELIPLCHAVALTHVGIDIQVNELLGSALVKATVEARDRTGVEMEALTAVSVACLTIYDMLKGIDREIVIGDIKLLEKSGGRSGFFQRISEGEGQNV